MSLTGKFAFRRTLTGKVVLKVEQDVKAPWPFSRTGAPRKRWRDAKMVDLTEAAMRTLMDLRNQPQQVVHVAVGDRHPVNRRVVDERFRSGARA